MASQLGLLCSQLCVRSLGYQNDSVATREQEPIADYPWEKYSASPRRKDHVVYVRPTGRPSVNLRPTEESSYLAV